MAFGSSNKLSVTCLCPHLSADTGYSATDLNQILGVVPGTEDPFAAAAAAAFGASRGASDDDKEEDEDKEDRPQAKKAKTEKKEKAKKEKRKSKGKAQGSDEEAEEEEAGRTARAVSEKGATVSAGARDSAPLKRAAVLRPPNRLPSHLRCRPTRDVTFLSSSHAEPLRVISSQTAPRPPPPRAKTTRRRRRTVRRWTPQPQAGGARSFSTGQESSGRSGALRPLRPRPVRRARSPGAPACEAGPVAPFPRLS